MELFARIRHDARVEGLSIRALAKRHGVGRATVRQALSQAEPPTRKTPVRVAPFKAAIDARLVEDLTGPREQQFVLALICAPSVGSIVVSLFGWRSVFVALAGLGVLMSALTAALVPADRAHVGTNGTGVLAGFSSVLRAPRYRRWLLGSCMSAVAGFTYVGFSPFVLQQQLHLSSTGFTAVFTINALGLTLASLVFRRLVGRVQPLVLVVVGTAIGLVAATGLTVLAATGDPTPAAVAPLLGAAVAATGLAIPATTVLLQQAGSDAPGTAGALQGASNYAVGAVAAPALAAVAGPTLVVLGAVLAVAAAAQLVLAVSSDRIMWRMLGAPTSGPDDSAS